MIESVLFLKQKRAFTGFSIEQDRGQGHVVYFIAICFIGRFLLTKRIIYCFGVYIELFVMKQPERQLKYAVTQYDTCITTCMYHYKNQQKFNGLSFVFVS